MAQILTDCCSLMLCICFEHIPARSIPLIGECPVRLGCEMYEWFISSLKKYVPIVWSGFPGTDVSLGLCCDRLCLLPVRRAVRRSTKMKCCDSVPDAVSSDATICATRRSPDGARVSRCSLLTEHATVVLWVRKRLSSSCIYCLTRSDRTRSAHSMLCSLFASKIIVD